MEPFVQQALVMNLAYLLVAILALAGTFHLFVKLLGQNYDKIMGKLENDALATALFFGLGLYAIASLVSGILH